MTTQLPHPRFQRHIYRILIAIILALGITSIAATNLYGASIPIAEANNKIELESNECSHVTQNNMVYCGNPDKPEIQAIDIHSGQTLHTYPVPQSRATVMYLGNLEEADIILIEEDTGKDGFSWLAAAHNGEYVWKNNVEKNLHCGFTTKDATIICTEFKDPGMVSEESVSTKVTTINAHNGEVTNVREVFYDVEN
ncbi:hypothetical protein [Corynebacterium freiburgense]|uniref:hypothetical protein n=1 Tax=Corynebacterium freiburgense TaxID=556548 RepID=UPI00047DA94F|nr:hypothetical protein [Corynebacterium freiburgense]WJZ03372.1 hypothetical protein CFREI_10490 [Corynebacterium freiburgense]